MIHPFARIELLIGSNALEKLKRCKVAVFGIGGVGSFAVESLIRSGVGNLVLVDHDNVCITNINRQIHATSKTVGRPKVEVMKDRILDINPLAKVTVFKKMYDKDTAKELITDDYDYVIDAIDMVPSKIDLIVRCKSMGVPIISSMGTGNKFDSTLLKVADIYETSICPLARVIRKELRKRSVASLKVVYSIEEPIKPLPMEEAAFTVRKQIVGSTSFVPPAAGLIIAGEVIRGLIGYGK